MPTHFATLFFVSSHRMTGMIIVVNQAVLGDILRNHVKYLGIQEALTTVRILRVSYEIFTLFATVGHKPPIESQGRKLGWSENGPTIAIMIIFLLKNTRTELVIRELSARFDLGKLNRSQIQPLRYNRRMKAK